MGQSYSAESFEQGVRSLGPNYFSKSELRKLFGRFNQLAHGRDYVTRDDLQMIPELQLNPLTSRISQLFVDTRHPDKSIAEPITFRSFVQALNVFSPLASEDEKLKFVFQVFDADGDGQISKQELFRILKLIVGGSIEDVQLELLAQGTITDADDNKDGMLDWVEFRSAILRNPDIKNKLTVRF